MSAEEAGASLTAGPPPPNQRLTPICWPVQPPERGLQARLLRRDLKHISCSTCLVLLLLNDGTSAVSKCWK